MQGRTLNKRTGGLFRGMPHSSKSSSRLIASVRGRNSFSTARSSNTLMSSTSGAADILLQILTNARVPSFLFFCVCSADLVPESAPVNRDRYLSAKSRSVSTVDEEHPVCRRTVRSSARDIGRSGRVKNMFACSAVSQSLSGWDLEAVARMRKEGCATLRPSFRIWYEFLSVENERVDRANGALTGIKRLACHGRPMGTTQEDKRLAVLRAMALLDTEPEVEFDTIVDGARQLFGCKSAFISLIDADRLD